jgi:hypothetical protein
MLQDWIGNAHTWASSYHKWPFTEGKNSTTYTTSVTDEMGNTLVAYPEGWKADSIRTLLIGGKRFQKSEFNSFLRFIEDNPGKNDRIYSDYARQLYINTNAGISGTLVVFGQYNPVLDVTDLTATTIFSNYDEEGNEAIIEKASSYLKRREHFLSEAELHDQRASAKLEEIWQRIQDEQFAYQPKDQAMFEDFDVVRGRGINQVETDNPNRWA